MYDPKLYIVSLTITTGLVPQVFEVIEVRASPPPPCSTSKSSISAFVVAPKKKIKTLRSLIGVTFC